MKQRKTIYYIQGTPIRLSEDFLVKLCSFTIYTNTKLLSCMLENNTMSYVDLNSIKIFLKI